MIGTAGHTQPWTPLVEASFVEARLREIAADLRARAEAPGPPGVLAGRAGLPLFFLHYARYTGDPADQAYAESLTSTLFETLPDEAPLALCSGLAGAAWLLRHAAAEQLIDADADALLEDLDTQLAGQVVAEMRAGSWDYLHGACGCAAYLLSAAGRADVRASLVSVIDSLDQQAIRANERVRWRNALMEPFAKDFEGVAHGVAGIAGMLTAYARVGVDAARTTALLRETLASLDRRRPRRTAWCYGDPGIAMVQWEASRVAGEPAWAADALSAATAAARHRSRAEAGIEDGSVCHGSAGLALMFGRFHQFTGHAIFADAARWWLTDALTAGVQPDDPDSVLLGVAGIGLVLMALSSPQAPSWDRLLLIS
jgi:lantibiotic modifying enzyme